MYRLVPLKENPFELHEGFNDIWPERDGAPEADVKSYLKDPGTERKMLLMAGDVAIGITGLWEMGDKLALAWTGIIPRFRGLGLSKVMMTQLIKMCSYLFPDHYTLVECVPADRESEIGPYFEKLGFIRTGNVVDHPELYDKVVWMEYTFPLEGDEFKKFFNLRLHAKLIEDEGKEWSDVITVRNEERQKHAETQNLNYQGIWLGQTNLTERDTAAVLAVVRIRRDNDNVDFILKNFVEKQTYDFEKNDKIPVQFEPYFQRNNHEVQGMPAPLNPNMANNAMDLCHSLLNYFRDFTHKAKALAFHPTGDVKISWVIFGDSNLLNYFALEHGSKFTSGLNLYEDIIAFEPTQHTYLRGKIFFIPVVEYKSRKLGIFRIDGEEAVAVKLGENGVHGIEFHEKRVLTIPIMGMVDVEFVTSLEK